MVAAPIAIVTSYVLFQRLVLGQERKKLAEAERLKGSELGIVGSREVEGK
jgi:hypothetical protein